MRIVLSKEWRIACGMLWIMLMIVHAYMLYLWGREGYYMLFLMIFWPIDLLGCVMIFLVRKMLVYTKINNNVYESGFMKKSLCRIDGNLKTYYAIVNVFESTRNVKSYIVLSESKFDKPIDKKKMERDFLRTYDWKKFIVLPYNDKTICFLNIDKWELVY